jgi:hypothetical protein
MPAGPRDEPQGQSLGFQAENAEPWPSAARDGRFRRPIVLLDDNILGCTVVDVALRHHAQG